MADFKLAYRKIIGRYEGGYVNDPDDRGGETYKGIARNRHPEWHGWQIIDDYKARKQCSDRQLAVDKVLQDLVMLFYKTNYWDELAGDQLRHQEVAEEMLDTGVNQGVQTAVRFLQQAVNLLNKNQRLWKDLKVDGIMGPNTLGTANQASMESLIKCLNGFQFMRYAEICLHNPSQEKFMHGWLTRI